MAARNLTIDRAPTNPRESAKDDFTTNMITTVMAVSIGKIFAKFSRFDIEPLKR